MAAQTFLLVEFFSLGKGGFGRNDRIFLPVSSGGSQPRLGLLAGIIVLAVSPNLFSPIFPLLRLWSGLVGLRLGHRRGTAAFSRRQRTNIVHQHPNLTG